MRSVGLYIKNTKVKQSMLCKIPLFLKAKICISNIPLIEPIEWNKFFILPLVSVKMIAYRVHIIIVLFGRGG